MKKYRSEAIEALHEAIQGLHPYDEVMREVEALTIRGKARSAAETEYYRILCALIGDYERSVGADHWPKTAPLDALRELMEFQGVTQSEIANALGVRAAASSILSGRRQISKAQARKLAILFRLDACVFI
ncbi:MAG TPA: helix-turn-helix domain-containing protein [Candidatus Baltobacteraceae bacterium]|nr:helix-turn-helix domain-containing protein [Candidatus Baltobacteraceae bacterium]